LRAKLALAFARLLERRGEVERALRMMETLVALGLGSERWREQAESRIRRLSKKKWREALPTAS
jgi:lipopolysaccharide biosynthesis regulator YciM